MSLPFSISRITERYGIVKASFRIWVGDDDFTISYELEFYYALICFQCVPEESNDFFCGCCVVQFGFDDCSGHTVHVFPAVAIHIFCLTVEEQANVETLIRGLDFNTGIRIRSALYGNGKRWDLDSGSNAIVDGEESGFCIFGHLVLSDECVRFLA